jgi:hypothetical protein
LLSKKQIGKNPSESKKEINMVAFDKEWCDRLTEVVISIKVGESQDDLSDDEKKLLLSLKQELNNLLFGYI